MSSATSDLENKPMDKKKNRWSSISDWGVKLLTLLVALWVAYNTREFNLYKAQHQDSNSTIAQLEALIKEAGSEQESSEYKRQLKEERLRVIQENLERSASVTDLLEEAESHRTAKELEEALRALEKILKLEPDNLAALNRCGEIEIELGRPEKAITIYKEITNLYPTGKEAQIAFHRLGKVLETTGQISESLVAFEKAEALVRKTDAWMEALTCAFFVALVWVALWFLRYNASLRKLHSAEKQLSKLSTELEQMLEELAEIEREKRYIEDWLSKHPELPQPPLNLRNQNPKHPSDD